MRGVGGRWPDPRDYWERSALEEGRGGGGMKRICTWGWKEGVMEYEGVGQKNIT